MHFPSYLSGMSILQAGISNHILKQAKDACKGLAWVPLDSQQ